MKRQKFFVMLKKEIEKVNGIETLPLNPEDISLAAMKKVVPKHLKHFVQCLCGASEHKLLTIVSIAQSIIFMSSDAQKKMPKQVGLGVSLKASLRSRICHSFKYVWGKCELS